MESTRVDESSVADRVLGDILETVHPPLSARTIVEAIHGDSRHHMSVFLKW
jgi:hypothetical protein